MGNHTKDLIYGIENFRELLYLLPKCEIHLHLEGMVRADSVWKLIEKNDLRINGIHSQHDLEKKFFTTSLDEFINVFINVVQNSFQTIEDFNYLFIDAANYLQANNIQYAEIFFAPTKFIKNGFSFDQLTDMLDRGVKMLEEKYNITVRILIDISRTYGAENAAENLAMLLRNKNDSIIGIGLGGAEKNGDIMSLQWVFQQARDAGLRTVAHAGEVTGPKVISDTVQYLKVERLGHATSAYLDPSLMKILAEKKIPIEVCPTSNIFTKKYVEKIEEHPIKVFFDNSLVITLNTDDPTFFQTNLVDEYCKLLQAGLFNEIELLKILKNGIYATFLSKEEKDKFWQKVVNIINKSEFNGFNIE